MNYTLIIPSASRPHLLESTLVSLLGFVDLLPTRIIIHDDARFLGKQDEVEGIITRVINDAIPWVLKRDNPPIGHGPSIHWLLNQVQDPYVLYSQDDHVVVRELPIRETLATMDSHGLHHVRFNKRTTSAVKGNFVKREVIKDIPLVVSDHWYFQTSLWRVAQIKPVVDWWMQERPQGFSEHCEVKINDSFNGGTWVPGPYMRPPMGSLWNDSHVREQYQRTFIYGRIGDPPFIHHTGTDPADFALERNRT